MQGALVLTTLPDEKTAADLAQKLVLNRWAACVNIIHPVKSYYFWENRLQLDNEAKLFIKTSKAKWPSVRDFIAQNHPYSTPEITLISDLEMHEPYLRWLSDYTTRTD